MVTLLTLLACSGNDENVSSTGLDGQIWDVENPDGSTDNLELTSYPIQDTNSENYDPDFGTWYSDSMSGPYSLGYSQVVDHCGDYWVPPSEENGGYYETRCTYKDTANLALTLYTRDSYDNVRYCEPDFSSAVDQDCPISPIASYVLSPEDGDWIVDVANIYEDSPYVSDVSDIPLQADSVLLAE